MESSQNQVMPRKKTFWKMVKTMFIPAQTIAKLMVGCGGKRGKRRLTMRNMRQAKEAFMRASFQGAINRSSNNRIHSEHRRHETETGPSENTDTTANNRTGSSNEVNEDQQNRAANGQHETRVHDITTASTESMHTPLNLEEAQILLESLALSSIPPISFDSATTSENSGNSILNLETVTLETTCSSFQNHDFSDSREVHNDGENNSQSVEHENDDGTRRQLEMENNYGGNDERNRSASISISNPAHEPSQAILRRSRTTTSFSSSVADANEFSGWRNSSIEVTSNPPVTLAFIPSGLCVGDRIVWVKDDYPEIGTVRWIGKIRQQFYAGIEFDKPVGNSSGIYGYGLGMYKRLFTCQLGYGRFVPVKELVLYKDYHDSGVKSGIVCVICREDFLDTWDPDISPRVSEAWCNDDMQPFNMVSTRCGHLYHWGCLDQWFSTKKRNEFHCPFCSRPMERNEVIRIFPSQL